MSIRRRTWEIMDTARDGDAASRMFNIFMLSLIFVNVIAVIVGSVPAIEAQHGEELDAFETFSVLIFTVEYVARMWSCTTDTKFSGPVKGRIRHALRAMSIIDLIAILPFYLPLMGADLRSVRVFRLVRILRIAKVGRYSSSLNLMSRVFSAKKEELILTTMIMGLLLIISSSLLYYCENAAQPESFSSIPATMWWSVATLTTVGYGDIYPVTLLGKLCASIIAVLGIGMFALPTGVLGAGFVEEIQKEKLGQVCPHCGKRIS